MYNSISVQHLQDEAYHLSAVQIELQALQQWVVRDAAKIPYNPLTGRRAASNDPSTWASYQDALNALQAFPDRYQGLGLMFTAETGIMGIDLDHCIDEQGNIDQWAQDVLIQVGSYTERSPSGEGVHILVHAALPDHAGKKVKLAGQRHPKAAIEMYDSGRYFTITWNHLDGTPTTLKERSNEVLALYSRLARPGPLETPQNKEPDTLSDPIPSPGSCLNDDKLLEKAMNAKNGTKFTALWHGDTSGYQGDDSSADLALCDLLAFWTNKDSQQIDRLFRRSGLMRDKWDRNARAGETYGEGTIKRAIEQCRETYTPSASLNQHIDTLLQDITTRQQVQGKRKRKPYKIFPRDVPLKNVLKYLDENEWGDANFFKEAFEGKVCYDHTEKEWYLWAGHYWQRDQIGHIQVLVAGVLGGLYLKAQGDLNPTLVEIETQIASLEAPGMAALGKEEAEKLHGLKDKCRSVKGQMQALHARAIALRTAKRSKNVQVSIQSLLPVTSDQWDKDPWKLATTNGVIDLRTGECRDGHPDDYTRTVCSTEWTGLETPCLCFEQFLQQIFEDKQEHRASLIAFLQRFLGYGITGQTNEAIFPIFYGEEGRNGKDTLFKVLKQVLGPYVGAVSNDVFVSQERLRAAGAATPHLCDLHGKRLVWGSETKQGDRFNVAQVKQLTGGGDISARANYGKQYAFAPTHKLLLLTNYKPHADAGDKAFWERACLIDFGMRFVDQPKADNERKKDSSLSNKLAKEASGILAWLVRGCLEWQRQGLAIPEMILLDTKEYQKEEDSLSQFIETCCIVRSHATARAKALYEVYKEWCRDNQLHAMNGTLFGLEIGKRYKKDRVTAGMIYQGIGLRDTDVSPDNNVGSQKNTNRPYIGHERPSEATLEQSQQEGYVGYVGVNHKSVQNRPSTPPFKEDSTHRPTYPTCRDSVNGCKPASEADEEPMYGHSGPYMHPAQPHQARPEKCSTAFERRMAISHEPGTQLSADAEGNLWCEKCLKQQTLMNEGQRMNYPRLVVERKGQNLNLQGGKEQWFNYARKAGYTYTELALQSVQKLQGSRNDSI